MTDGTNINTSTNASAAAHLSADVRCWLPPAVTVSAALICARALSPWASMWTIAFALFFACKWFTWWPWRGRASARRTVAYFLTWPGMEARRFFDPTRAVPAPDAWAWLRPAVNIALGTAIVLVLARIIPESRPLARGWATIIGLALMLHFGLLHMLALAWQSAGVDAPALMNEPSRATSLGEFWGSRWNTAFHVLAHDYVFAPLRRKVGVVNASIATYLASGIVHELVITVPARGGYGLPTLYFLIQCAALLFERSDPARRIGISRRLWTGRAFTVAVVILPLPLLFPTPFVVGVIVPFVNLLPSISEVPMPKVEVMLLIAGALHLCITSAGVVMTIVLNWRRTLAPLDALTRHVIWTHGGFVLMTIIGFGVISLTMPSALASGTPLARGVCGFIAAFWAIRLVIQFFLFDARPFLTNRWLAAGYHGLTVVFSYFVITYGLAAVR